ncbi:hypothetical protein Tco_1314419 [Tanacetum coccineum]
MEAHCIALELKYQNQALKSGQHGQILNETSNKAKIEKEIDVLETMNIELEHSVAKLLKRHRKVNMGIVATSSATWVVCIDGGENGSCEVDGALMGVCDGTQLGLLILHPVKSDPEQALFEIMECPP